MKLDEVKDILDAKPAWKQSSLDHGKREVSACQASDLMSDVLNFQRPGSLLLTGLTNSQVVRTAEVGDIAAICFVRDKWPQEETVRLAEEQGLPLLVTRLTMFEACGKLYGKGLGSCANKEVAPDCQSTR